MKHLFESFNRWLNEDDLIESRIKDLKAKYPGQGQWIDKLSEADPSGKNKYLGWMVKQFMNAPGDFDEMYDVVSDLGSLVTNFHKNQKRLEKKDINQYKSVADLEDAIANLGVSGRQKRKKEKSVAMEGSTIIREDDDFFVIRPDTTEASCYYGKNTQWCIAATQSRNYFKQYTGEGKVFYFLRNEHLRERDRGKKIAFVWASTEYDGAELEEFYDAEDSSIGEDEVRAHIGRNMMAARGEDVDYRNFKSVAHKRAIEDKASDLSEEVYIEIINEMEVHAEENPADTSESEEEYERITDEWNNKFEHVTLYWDDNGEGQFYYQASAYLDLSELKWTVNLEDMDWKEKSKVEDAIRGGLHEASVYPDDGQLEAWDGEIKYDLQFYPNDGYSGGSEGYEEFANDMHSTDGEIGEAMASIIEYLAEAGFVKGAPSQQAADIVSQFGEFKNIRIERDRNEVNVHVPLQVNLPPGLYDKLSYEDIGELRRFIKQSAGPFSGGIKHIVQQAKEYASRQMSLFERLVPLTETEMRLVVQSVEEDAIKADYQIVIPWSEEEEKIKKILLMLQFIDKKYNEVNKVFIRMIKDQLDA